MKYIAFFIGIVTVIGGYIAYQNFTGPSVGSTMSGSVWFLNASQQIQAGLSTWGLRIPSLSSAGDCLVTNASGVVSTSSCGGGGSSKWTDEGSIIYPTTFEAIRVPYIISSSSATSTFNGPIVMQHADFLTTHGIRGDASDGLYVTSNSGLNVADFGIGNTQNTTFYGAVNIDGNTRLATSLTGILRADGGTVSTQATGTLSESVTGLEFNANRDLLGGSATLSLSTGYVIPTSTLWSAVSDFYTTPSTRITAGTNLSWSGNTLNATGGGGATSTMVVCASGCTYSSIQDALNAGYTNIELKAESYAGPISIPASDTRIRGAGLYSSIITCAATAATNCVKIATSSNLTRITIEHLGIDNTLTTTLGTGLDTSNTSNVYITNVRITDFNLGHLHQDTNNQSFYSSFNNMVYFDNNNCFATAGTKSNDNSISHARCRVATSTGIGYKLVDAEGWLLSSVNSEPGSVIGTGLYIDGTSISNTIINPWFEANATGTEILAGALNTSIKGGRITAGTVGVSDLGTRTFLDSTLVSANTTDFAAGSTGITMINGRSTFSAPSILVGTTTPNSTYERLVLGLSTSEATANMLTLNNYGAFATSPTGILFNNSSGGFATGTARIYVNPGSGYTAAKMSFSVANSSKALIDRMVIDVDGDVGIASTSPNARLSVVGTSGGTIMQIATDVGVKIMDILNTGVATLLGAWDFGGATSIEIVNGTAPTVDATGEIAFDTTDNQFLIATGTNARAIPTITKLWSATIASSSVDFASGGRIPLPPHRDGVVITEVHCFVDGGTSKVINLDTMAGGAQLDSLTCGTTLTSDTAQSANFTLSAGALMALEFGATTGAVDYVTFSAWGFVSPE